MFEYTINLHIHTRYSDGTETHAQIADAAIEAGVDCIIFTDHNVLVRGFEGYLRKNGRKLLILVGEEIHDQARQPQKNHLLVFGIDREMATFADKPQGLIDRVTHAGGLTFIAHPFDPALPLFHEDDISWINWEVQNYTGIEIWNGLSELKIKIKNWLDALRFGFNAELLAHGPHPSTLQQWDSLLAVGRRIVAIGGSDAHQLNIKVGPFKRKIFPYRYHFRAINTHILTEEKLTWLNYNQDQKMVLQAIKNGHCYIGYDLPASTKGFNFTGQAKQGVLQMGDDVEIKGAVTLQVRLPMPAECRLIQDGRIIKTWTDQEVVAYITKEPGVYRVEVYIWFLGKKRGWIFSNPIYLRPASSEKFKGTGPEWSQTTLPDF